MPCNTLLSSKNWGIGKGEFWFPRWLLFTDHVLHSFWEVVKDFHCLACLLGFFLLSFTCYTAFILLLEFSFDLLFPISLKVACGMRIEWANGCVDTFVLARGSTHKMLLLYWTVWLPWFLQLSEVLARSFCYSVVSYADNISAVPAEKVKPIKCLF